jgi:hypothetical protein
LHEKVKCDTYKHYENIVKTTPEKDLKHRLPLLKVPQSTHVFLEATDVATNRLAVNFSTGFFKMNCTAKLKYGMPTPLAPFTAKL